MHNATQSQRDARASVIVQHYKLPDAETRGYCSHLICLVASDTVILQNRARLQKGASIWLTRWPKVVEVVGGLLLTLTEKLFRGVGRYCLIGCTISTLCESWY